mmetsp:Transcript_107213/g.290477  ORF Transcript_107213/g.290477 Transcript_107213/m.290477 type:complete len:111 (-) Transcript_107213:345-677(-)
MCVNSGLEAMSQYAMPTIKPCTTDITTFNLSPFLSRNRSLRFTVASTISWVIKVAVYLLFSRKPGAFLIVSSSSTPLKFCHRLVTIFLGCRPGTAIASLTAVSTKKASFL